MQLPSNTELIVFSQSEIILDINRVKNQIDALRPIAKDREDQIMQKLKLDWNYNSNAIEGNSLDYGETVGFLMNGLTAKGKPLKDHLDIKGHNEAIDFLMAMIDTNQDFTEKDIRSLHEVILVEPYKSAAQTMDGQPVQKTIKLGQYKSLPNHVQTITGETHYYATPEDTPILMAELMDWYRSVQHSDSIHPVVIAAIFHHRFAAIHPFDDGNGRMARLLMNLIVMKAHYPPIVIKKERRDQYYFALSQADTGNDESFINYVSEGLLSTVQVYLKGALGESIEEPTDLDKRIALFKKEVNSRKDKIEVKRSQEIKEKIAYEKIAQLAFDIKVKVSKFKEFFLEQQDYVLNHVNFWQYNGTTFDPSSRFNDSVAQYNFLVFCYQFREFRTESNNFSFEIKTTVLFNELDYKIYLRVSPEDELKDTMNASMLWEWFGDPILSKYYHQEITQDDIDKVVQEVGNKAFDYIQQAYSDPKIKEVKITKEELAQEWPKFTSELRGFKDTQRLVSLAEHLFDIKVLSNRISILIAPTSGNQFSTAFRSLEDLFRGYLMDKKLIGMNDLVIVRTP